ncbi:hypothetical protein [Gluconacetobacter tumulicola]|uniref:hypothetical protein n=1 Tax=Gluconacetobacter tumulicola TaxID=1017177 RepID=UPI0031E9C5AB
MALLPLISGGRGGGLCSAGAGGGGGLRRVRLALRDDPDRPWQTVFNAMRRQAGAIWAALSVAGRRLVRHLRPFWDTRRRAGGLRRSMWW